MEELKRKYWQVLVRTRKSGRISQSVKEKEEEYWAQFPEDVVKEALRIHISRYPAYRESYTRGIMRNLMKQKEAGRPVAKQNSFQQFEQNDYDFEKLEQELLAN